MLENPYYDPDYYFDEEDEDEYYDEGPEDGPYGDAYPVYHEPSVAYSPEAGWLVGLIAFLFLLFLFARSGLTTTWEVSDVQAGAGAEAEPVEPQPFAGQEAEPEPREADALAFEAPYSNYVLTQGPHGQSYGHLAIDLAAGKGAAILSPINGRVTEKYTDQWGNPTIIIENDVYQVKMLHGIYSAEVGQRVSIGEQVGVESNLGYTTDMRGVRCAGRTDYCGYHTHLNVYDKTQERNVNPLSLIND